MTNKITKKRTTYMNWYSVLLIIFKRDGVAVSAFRKFRSAPFTISQRILINEVSIESLFLFVKNGKK